MAKNFTAETTVRSTKGAARKPRAKKSETVTLHSLESMSTEDEFSALLSALGASPDMDEPGTQLEEPPAVVEIEVDSASAVQDDSDVIDLDTVLNTAVVEIEDSQVETMLSDKELEDAVSRAEATELMVAAVNVEEAAAGAVPTGDATDVAPGDAEEGTTTKAKRAAAPRKFYADKVERLKDRIGDSLAEYTVLTTADALGDDDALAQVMERTLEIIRQMNSKEKNRASNFIEFLSGKKAKLNNVLERVLNVLERDGFIQTGAEGNVIKDLLARPYSMASARAMGGNTISMYADLKVILPDGKGKFVANPDSLLLAKARSLLAAGASIAADDSKDTEIAAAA